MYTLPKSDTSIGVLDFDPDFRNKLNPYLATGVLLAFNKSSRTIAAIFQCSIGHVKH